MANNELTIISIEMDPKLTLAELCDVCQITPEFAAELLHYGVIEANDAKQQLFDVRQLQRIRRLLRLQRDLEVNLAGAALAIDLIEQMEAMEQKMKWLKALLSA